MSTDNNKTTAHMKQKDRIKTDIRLSPKLDKALDEFATWLGATKQGLVVVSLSQLLSRLQSLRANGKAPLEALDALEMEFSDAMREVRAGLKA